MSHLEFNIKKCNTCGESSQEDLTFCRYCGSLLEAVKEEAPQVDTLHVQEDRQLSEDQNIKREEPQLPYFEKGDVSGENMTEKFSNTINTNTRPVNISSRVQPKNNSLTTVVKKNSISNGLKVFLTVICTAVPGFGQLVCLILAIIFMNSEGDGDKRSFGVALFIASLVLFVLTCIIVFILILAIYQPPQM